MKCGEEGLTWFTVRLYVNEDFTVVLWWRPDGWDWTYYFEDVDEMWREGFNTLDEAIDDALKKIDTYFNC
jgi:hypothetical protein